MLLCKRGSNLFLYIATLTCFIFSYIPLSRTSARNQGFADIDKSKYDEGERQYALMKFQSKVPKYGQCWKDAIVMVQKGCKELDDVMQSRLALAYLNCFLDVQGRKVYPCDFNSPIHKCTNSMNDADRGSFTTFFTHTQNICYFLESQIWHQETGKTIDRLSSSSEEVANRLEESSELQNEMIKRQNVTLQNQEVILDKASNLSDIISESKQNIHEIFEEFKKTTDEQRMLINDIFDRVAKLQMTILGEFSGFYSIVYYTLSVLISYLLTSAQRTSSARFWLFGIMTLGVIAERSIIYTVNKNSKFMKTSVVAEAELEESLYGMQWMCRKFCGVTALLVLGICAYRYKDINVINNQLLNDIKRQVSQIRYSIESTGSHGNLSSGDAAILPVSSSSPTTAAADSTGYETDSAVSECSYLTGTSFNSLVTDHTFQPMVTNWRDSDTSSSISEITNTSSSMLTELENLRDSTPLRDMSSRIGVWAQTGYYKHSTPVKDSEDKDSSIADSVKKRQRSKQQTPPPGTSATPTRYNLRKRKQSENPLTKSESPMTFGRVVKTLEKIAIENSMRGVGYTVHRKSNTSKDSH